MFNIPLIIKSYGLIGINIIVLLESSIFPILPGDSLLFTAGFLASQNLLPITLLFLSIFVSAIIGNVIGYFIGWRYGSLVFSRPESFFLNPDYIQTTRLFFQKYGSKSIVLARFVPIVRTFIPVFAGVGKMPFKTFVFYNIIGALLWSSSLVYGGYYISHFVPNADKHIHQIVFVILLVSFLPGIMGFIQAKMKNTPKIQK